MGFLLEAVKQPNDDTVIVGIEDAVLPQTVADTDLKEIFVSNYLFSVGGVERSVCFQGVGGANELIVWLITEGVDKLFRVLCIKDFLLHYASYYSI